MASEFVTAIKTIEVATGGITANDVRGTRVAVANVAGTYYVLSDTRRPQGSGVLGIQPSEKFSVQWTFRPRQTRRSTAHCGDAVTGVI
jgi:hypothetical protein